MASTIPTKPKKSLSNTVWILFTLNLRDNIEGKYIEGIYASKTGATDVALTHINRDIERSSKKGVEAKIHVLTDDLRSSDIGHSDWWHQPSLNRWFSSSFSNGYMIVQHNVIHDESGYGSMVWVQTYRKDAKCDATIYDIEGVYGSESLAVSFAKVMDDNGDENYCLESHQIQVDG